MFSDKGRENRADMPQESQWQSASQEIKIKVKPALLDSVFYLLSSHSLGWDERQWGQDKEEP